MTFGRRIKKIEKNSPKLVYESIDKVLVNEKILITSSKKKDIN